MFLGVDPLNAQRLGVDSDAVFACLFLVKIILRNFRVPGSKLGSVVLNCWHEHVPSVFLVLQHPTGVI